MVDRTDSGDARAVFLALLDDNREHLADAWTSKDPVIEPEFDVWVVLHADGYATGAGGTRAEAWRSAAEAERLSMRGDDDSTRYATDLGTIKAELLSRTDGHHASRVQLTPGGVKAFCRTVDVRPGDRVYALIEAVVRAAGDEP